MNSKTSNTIGWILIFAVMGAFFYINRDTPEKQAERARIQAYNDSLRNAEIENAAQEVLAAQARMQQELADSSNVLFGTSFGEEQTCQLKNDIFTLTISNKGGTITSAVLNDYMDQQGQPIELFDATDASLCFLLDGKNENIVTRDRYFQIVESTDSSALLRLQTNGAGSLDIRYALVPGSSMVNMSVQAQGMQNFFPSQMNTMGVQWNQRMRHQEKGYTFEQRFTYLSYREQGENPKHLSEMKNKSVHYDFVDWVAFKNQFFCTVLIAPQEFSNATLSSTLFNEKDNSSARITDADTIPSFYMKKLEADMTASFDPTGAKPTQFQLYIGPNQFKSLKAASKLSTTGQNLKLDKLIYMGWPIVRLVNRYVIVYLFDFLSRFGLNMGIVLLLLTFIVKMLVQPFTYKQFMSTAKMRALKPHLAELDKKYPNPEDAMQKQQEQMHIYSQYGVSPMGGCLPALIQMPIWMALFFFVPNAIELRQEPFLWASDLSAYDDLLSWNTNIPLIGNHLSIFCLLFCLVNVLNTVYSMRQQPAAAGQEQSQKMMKWSMYLMPIIFFFTLNNYSSGLNYYYCISSLMTIIIMIIMRRTTNEEKLLKQLEANYEKNKQNPPKKSNMYARLEAMQKEQERMQQQQQARGRK